MKNKLNLKKADLIILTVVIFTAIVLFALKTDSGALTAQITVDGETVHEVILSSVEKTYTFFPGNGTEIEISQDHVRFLSSDCGGKDCVNCGKLTRAGETAVCIPNKTLIRLSGKDNSSPDILTY